MTTPRTQIKGGRKAAEARREAGESDPHDPRDEQAYAAIADEMNDAPESYLFGKPKLDEFDTPVVRAGARYAEAHGLAWPPQTGDFDRYYETVVLYQGRAAAR